MEQYVNDAIGLLRQLIATPSVSRDEARAADVMSQHLEAWGLPYGREGNNLWVGCQDWDDNRPTVMLNAHIDTVKPVATWTRNPFEPAIEGDKLYGLGSNDCGGGLVATLQAYRIMLHAPRTYNILWVCSAEEEVSGKDGFSRVLHRLPPIDVAIVGEPTGMQPATAEKGLMVIDVTEEGVAGHAARNEGVNAIYKAIDDINWVRNHRFERESPLLGPVKATVTIVNAGTQHNVVPAECKFTIDVRSNELYTNQELFDEISANLQGQAVARSYRLRSSSIDTSHPFVRCAMSMGLEPYGSPTLSNRALLPYTSVKMGPGQSARSHSADEFICISEIENAIETYQKLIKHVYC